MVSGLNTKSSRSNTLQFEYTIYELYFWSVADWGIFILVMGGTFYSQR